MTGGEMTGAPLDRRARAAKRTPMRTPKRTPKHLASAALVALIAASSAARAQDPASAAAAPRPVVSEILTADVAQARRFAGVVVAATQLNLAFQTLGRIASRDVRLGAQVKKGDVLARLDQVTLDEDVAAAEAAQSIAEAHLRTARSALARAEELAARRVAPAVRVEEARRTLASAEAARDGAAADLARARDAQGFSSLIAPMDGVIAATLVDAGAIVSPGLPVLTLAGDDGREVVIDVTDAVLRDLAIGTRFEVTARTIGSASVAGVLTEIEPVADAGTRTRRVHVTLTDPPAGLRLGALVRAAVLGRDGPLTTLPQSAILTGPNGPAVWRVTAGSRALALAPVTLGPDMPGDRVVIVQGTAPGLAPGLAPGRALALGDEIMTKGVNSVTDGQIVGPGVK
jgi:RND family efflux transporter MFP subunit